MGPDPEPSSLDSLRSLRKTDVSECLRCLDSCFGLDGDVGEVVALLPDDADGSMVFFFFKENLENALDFVSWSGDVGVVAEVDAPLVSASIIQKITIKLTLRTLININL